MIKFIEKYKYMICFFFLTALFCLIPSTVDDWTWGTQVGIDRLNSWFENYSGRYLGNLIVILLTRSKLLTVISKALLVTGIIYFIQRLTKSRVAFSLCSLLLLLTPKSVMRQAVTWTSGFANYCTSVVVILLYFNIFYWIFDKKEDIDLKKLKQRPVVGILLFVLGGASTLIVEHITIYSVVLSLFVVAFILIKFKKILIQYVCYMVGAVAGALYMFSNSVYHSVASGDDFYRTVAFSPVAIIKRAFDNYFDIIYKEFYMNNIWINIAIFIVALMVFISLRDKLSQNHRKNSVICIFINGCYLVWSVLSVIGVTDAKLKPLTYFEGILTLISGLSLIDFIIITSLYVKNTAKMLFIMGSILIITSTLFIVTPVSSRCFFAGYVLFMLLAVELCNMLPEKYIEKLSEHKIGYVYKTSIATMIAFYFFIFGSICKVDIDRIEYAKEKIKAGEKTVEIMMYPYRSYIHDGTPTNDFWKNAFRDYYEIPREVDITFVYEYSDTNN